MGAAAEGDPPLLHRFEQRRLGLGGGPVHLVGEDDVGEDGALVEPEGATLEHVGADDVGRHQVRRELDAPETYRERLAERSDEQRLAETRHPFQQHVALAEHAEQDGAHQVALSDDHLSDLVLDPGDALCEFLWCHWPSSVK